MTKHFIFTLVSCSILFCSCRSNSSKSDHGLALNDDSAKNVKELTIVEKLNLLDEKDILTGKDFIKMFPESKFKRYVNPGIAVYIPPSDHWDVDSERTLVLFPADERPADVILEVSNPGEEIQEDDSLVVDSTVEPLYIIHGIYPETRYSRFRLAGDRGKGLFESRTR